MMPKTQLSKKMAHVNQVVLLHHSYVILLLQVQRLKSSRKSVPGSMGVCRVRVQMRASQRSRTETVTVMTASNQSAQQTKTTISTHSEKSLMMMMVRILGEPGCKLKHFKVNWRKSVFFFVCLVFFPLFRSMA